jgi:DNA primase
VKVLVLPDDSDPDEFIRKFGLTEYQRQRSEAQPHIQFVIDQAVRNRNLHRPAEKADAVEEVLPYIRAVRSRIQKREYFDIAMDSLRISDAALRRELWHSLRLGPDNTRTQQKIVQRTQAKPTVAEEQLLELLIADEQLRHKFLPRLEPEDYDELPTAGIFRALVESEHAGSEVDFDSLSRSIEGDPIADFLPGLLMNAPEDAEAEQTETLELTAQKCIDALRLMQVDRRISDLMAEMSAADRNGATELRDRLATEQLELTRRRSTLLPQAQAVQTGQ